MSHISGNNTKENRIHVAMATDNNYLEYLSVAVCSILKNLSMNYDLSLYVLSRDLTEENKKIAVSRYQVN